MKPSVRPGRPYFSSGPCAKRPGWSPDCLATALAGRSHRSADGQARLRALLDLSREVLKLPGNYRIAVVPGSDTGALEMAMWSLLGERGVDMLAWDAFGADWVKDAREELRLADLRVIEADYGAMPDLSRIDGSRDVVFTWNGTTSGVRVPDGDWIPDDRAGLTICDATSAVFAMRLPWRKLDVVTYSWQKALGGEAAHGMLILGPRAVDRLRRHAPPWPIPKLFRLATSGKLAEDLYAGATINTPSLLCVEDQLDALRWAKSIGGLDALVARAEANLATLAAWVARSEWLDFLAEREDTRSCTSVCLRVVDPWFSALPEARRRSTVRAMCEALEAERVAYDIASYRDAPPGLRIWCGATVERNDLEKLTPWLDWAYGKVKTDP